MSSRIGILDGPGVNSYCLEAAIAQTKELVDEKRYQIVKFSEAPGMFDDLGSNPLSLVLGQGGNYKAMAPWFTGLSGKMHKYVKEYGGRYMGTCASAIGVSSKMLLFPHSLEPLQQNLEHEMQVFPGIEEDKLIKLYSGNCCYFNVPDGDLPSAVRVERIAEDYNDYDDYTPFHLFFNWGVFFPDAWDQPDTEVLLKSTDYRFSGHHMGKKYGGAPVIAFKQNVGNGSIVCCGGHTDITAEVLRKILYQRNFEIKAQMKAAADLQDSTIRQMDTARMFLNKLSIVTK
jgi:glutamine amidotransferase-like uncharacterized protein